MADYALRGIDPELWKLVKARAAREGRTVRAVLLDYLKAYAGQPQEHGSDGQRKRR